MTLVVKCPACAKDVPWTPKSPFRPFCSARCKQMDLGAWAAERYRIGGSDDEPSDDAADGQPDGGIGRRD